jgi:microcystin-dependent protein
VSDQWVGEIRAVGFNFAPAGWAMCNGQLLPISQNTALFSLLGTFYGGNGTSNFALPNLQAQIPLGMGTGPGLTPYVIGETAGANSVTIIESEMAEHNHVPNAQSSLGSTDSPDNAVWAVSRRGRVADQVYADSTPAQGLGQLNDSALSTIAGNQPHNNLPPYLVVNFIIALQGIFPARG